MTTLEISEFLKSTGWGEHVSMDWFSGDFSSRRYARLKRGQESAILMAADKNQKTKEFIKIAAFLKALGVHTPSIIAEKADKGLVLMEDLGTQNIGMLLDNGAEALPFYIKAAELLATLHNRTESDALEKLDIPLFNKDMFLSQMDLFLDFYIPYAYKKELSSKQRSDFLSCWHNSLEYIDTLPKSILLRDFMPDNLMFSFKSKSQSADVPTNTYDIGVLDFQDAGVGCVAYDVASLCEEVRRDGGFSLLPQVIDAYCAINKNITKEDMLKACYILSAQRHTRILGILAKLKNTDKIRFLPRVEAHLQKLFLKIAHSQPFIDTNHVRKTHKNI
ncbi:MAG: phosphotransferase [Alphaproteobacteria bacterium]|nr:phosphotransferase [Alphaproteobacteria bacterium]MCL2504858.1 phosphotransferase [Alphaproteobacteria bacterium]